MSSPYTLLLALLLMTTSYVAKGAVETSPPSLADYQAGETWIWKYKGVTQSGEVRADGTDTKKIIRKDNKLFMLSASRTVPLSQIVQSLSGKNSRYNWPLSVGKKWTYEDHWESEDGTKGSTIQEAEVVSYKAETVEAGTFMAYTIQYKGKMTNSHGYSAVTEDIHVYAPKLKTFIKLTQIQHDYVYVEELIEYKK